MSVLAKWLARKTLLMMLLTFPGDYLSKDLVEESEFVHLCVFLVLFLYVIVHLLCVWLLTIYFICPWHDISNLSRKCTWTQTSICAMSSATSVVTLTHANQLPLARFYCIASHVMMTMTWWWHRRWQLCSSVIRSSLQRHNADVSVSFLPLNSDRWWSVISRALEHVHSNEGWLSVTHVCNMCYIRVCVSRW